MRRENRKPQADFFKIAGVAGATIGMAGGLGGLVAACGDTEETTTTAGPTTTAGVTTTAGPTTTAGATTTVSAATEEGRPIKLGIVSPKTGNFSVFAISDDWWIARVNEIMKDGFITGDGKKRMLELIVKDSQSDSNRASQVAGDLVTNDQVDMLLASGTPDTANPTADQGEALGCPTLLSFAPWQALFFGADGKPKEFKWVYGNMLGSEQTIAAFTDAFETSGVETNKMVGMLLPNDADYTGWMAPPRRPRCSPRRATRWLCPSPTRSQPEFTSQITKFKSEGSRSSAAPTTRRGSPTS